MKLGYVKSGKERKSCEVHWDKDSKEVYVDFGGRQYVGHASTAGEAMDKAEAFLHNK
jgi:hypothetical protein